MASIDFTMIKNLIRNFQLDQVRIIKLLLKILKVFKIGEKHVVKYIGNYKSLKKFEKQLPRYIHIEIMTTIMLYV